MSTTAHQSRVVKKSRKPWKQCHPKDSTKAGLKQGRKCMRGEAKDYDEVKRRSAFTLTPTAKSGLEQLSSARLISMSELIERIGRGLIELVNGENMAHGRDENRKGRKCMRGVPEYYDEVKKTSTFIITPTAKSGLKLLSQFYLVSMSELIECVGRGLIKLAS